MQLKRNTEPQYNEKQMPARVEWPRIMVIVCTLLLVLIGIVMVFSSSSITNIDAGTDVFSDARKQIIIALFGGACCFAIARFLPYELLRGPLAWILFGISLVLLVLTSLMGTEALGAQRWISLGPLNLQPSEFAKIGIMVFAVKLLADYQDGAMDTRHFLAYFIALNALIVVLVTLAQSDLGTTLICFVGLAVMLWLAEVKLSYFLVYLGSIVAAGIAALVTASYRVARVMTFLDPWADYYGNGYQIIHSMYAFAQGGLFGAGLGNSAEKYLYLPEASTDFIYAVIGEELGLIGALFVVALFVLFLIGGLKMAAAAPDRFGSVLCGSLAVIIVFQAFLNMGCAMGIMPVTGKPLPFISAGGSSLLASLLMVGIMLLVSHAAETGSSPGTRAHVRALTPEEMGMQSPRRGGWSSSGGSLAGRRAGGRSAGGRASSGWGSSGGNASGWGTWGGSSSGRRGGDAADRGATGRGTAGRGSTGRRWAVSDAYQSGREASFVSPAPRNERSYGARPLALTVLTNRTQRGERQ